MRPTKHVVRIDRHNIILVTSGKNLIQVVRPITTEVPKELYQNVLSGVG